MRKINYRIDNLELRNCNISDDYGSYDSLEMVEWRGSDIREIVAHWKLDDNGYDLYYIGSRPFELNRKNYTDLIIEGQRILEEYNGDY